MLHFLVEAIIIIIILFLLCFLLLYPDAGLPVLHFAFDFVGGHTLDVCEHDALHDGDALWR